MKSGTFTSNTSFTASAASIVIPSEHTYIGIEEVKAIDIPKGVNVIALVGGNTTKYMGVTPSTTHALYHSAEEINGGIRILHNLYCRTHNGTGSLLRWITVTSNNDDFVTISWSTEINKKEPTVDHYET